MLLRDKNCLIVGLGNPGEAYAKTRHNLGFLALQAFSQKKGWTFRSETQLNGALAKGSEENRQVYLLLPTTYMNLSGIAVRKTMDYFKIPVSQVLVVVDDVNLELGKLRLRVKGSAGGHNGLKSIESHLGTSTYYRLRLGVGRKQGEEAKLKDYVLGKFLEEEQEPLNKVINAAEKVLNGFISCGIKGALDCLSSFKDDDAVPF